MLRTFSSHSLRADLARLAQLARRDRHFDVDLSKSAAQELRDHFNRVMMTVCVGALGGGLIIPIFDREAWPELLIAEFVFIVPSYLLAMIISLRAPIEKIGWSFAPYWLGTLLSLITVISSGDQHAILVHFVMATMLLLPTLIWHEAFKGVLSFGPPAYFLALLLAWYFGASHLPNGKDILNILFVFSLIVMFTTHVFRVTQLNLVKELNDHEAMVNELTKSNRLLDDALSSRQLGILFYNEKGELFTERGVPLWAMIPDCKPEDYDSIDKMKEFIRTRSGEEITELFVHNTKISFGSTHLLVSAHRLGGISVVTFIDVTRMQNLEMQLRAREKLSTIGQITSGLAHNYNNMLAIALANLEALPRWEDNDDWENFVAPAIEAIQQSADISHKLLKLSAKELKVERFDPGKLVADLGMFLRSILGAGVKLTLPEPEPCLIHVDRSELKSAILNLLINARNAMQRRGNITITIERAGEFARISVIDDGPGIPKHAIEKIFEPFFTTKNAANSSGLGLATVKSFVEQSGGHVEVESSPAGTCMSLYFPLDEGEAVAA